MDPDKWARGPEPQVKKYTSLTPPVKIFGRFDKPNTRPALPLPEHAHLHYRTGERVRAFDVNNVPQAPVKGTAKVVTIDLNGKRLNKHVKTESPTKVLRVFYGQFGPSNSGDEGKTLFRSIKTPPTVVLLCRANTYYNSARVGLVGHYDKGRPRTDLPQLVLDMPPLRMPAGRPPKVVWNIEYTDSRPGRTNTDKFVYNRNAELKGIEVLVVRILQKKPPAMGKWLGSSVTQADENERNKFLEALAIGISSILARHVGLRVIFIDTLKEWKSTGTHPQAWVGGLKSASKPSLRLLQFVSKVGPLYEDQEHRHRRCSASVASGGNRRSSLISVSSTSSTSGSIMGRSAAGLGPTSAQTSAWAIDDLKRRFEVMAESDYQRKYPDWKLEQVLESELEPKSDA